MALLAEHVSHIQAILNKGIKADDHRISDRHIYFILKYVRAKLIYQKAIADLYINPFNYQTIRCFRLKLDSLSDCSKQCGMTLLKGVCPLPKVLENKYNLLINQVFLDDGTMVSMSSIRRARTDRYDKYRSKEPFWFIVDNEFYFWEPKLCIRNINITGAFEDPLSLQVLNDCCDTQDPCFDPLISEFPMDESLIADMHKMTIGELLPLYQLGLEDAKGNNNSDDTITPSEVPQQNRR